MNSEKQGQQTSGKKGYLFNVDILIEGYNNGIALETLLRILNQGGGIKDYKINQGMELGKIIDNMLQERKKAPAPAAPAAPKAKAVEDNKNTSRNILDMIEFFKNNNTLVRLSIVKAKGVKLSIPSRILNFDPSTHNLTVYHVDEKKVYQFHVNEIDDFNVN